MTESRVSVRALDGTSIEAIVAKPDTESGTRSHMTLLLHGITTHKDEYGDTFQRLARELADAGEQSLRLDFRGHGDSKAPLTEFNVRTQLLDLLAVARWLSSEQDVDRLRILAASFSAPAAITATLVLGQAVDKLVLLAPVLDFYETFVEPLTGWGEDNFGRERIISTLNGDTTLVLEPGFELGADFAADLLLVNVVPTLARLSCPVRILHGDQDGMVPLAVSKRVAAEYPNVALTVMDETEHGLAKAGDTDQESTLTASNYARVVAALSTVEDA